MFILTPIVFYTSVKFINGEDSLMLDEDVGFRCSRLSVTYCCTTRVRIMCKAQCSTFQCDSDFYRKNRKLKSMIVEQKTTYKNGLNDGDTADLRAGVQMKWTNRKPLSQRPSKKKYLPPPVNSEENESLIGISSNENNEITKDVISFIIPTISVFKSELEPINSILKPQSLLVTEGSQRKQWEIRSFNVTYHKTPPLNWPYNYTSNSNLAELEKLQCGTAPNFSPCISISQANSQFQECCKNRKLPASCQHSCKYNVKESELNTINGASFCAVLHITAILQCASNGQDNSECCRHKQIMTKSAPQCEIFCRSGQEIARVGLEHLVCRKVMDEIIACHLSGLRN